MGTARTVPQLIEEVLLSSNLEEREMPPSQSVSLRDLQAKDYQDKTLQDILSSWLDKAKGQGNFEDKLRDVAQGGLRGVKKGVHDPIFDLLSKLLDPDHAEAVLHDFAKNSIEGGVAGAKKWIGGIPKRTMDYFRGTGKNLDRLIVRAMTAYPELKPALKDIRARMETGKTSEAEARKQVFLAIDSALLERKRRRLSLMGGAA